MYTIRAALDAHGAGTLEMTAETKDAALCRAVFLRSQGLDVQVRGPAGELLSRQEPAG